MLFFDYFEIKKRGIEQENHLFNPSNYIIDYQLFTHHSSTAAYYLRYISKEQSILKHTLQILLAKLTIIFHGIKSIVCFSHF